MKIRTVAGISLLIAMAAYYACGCGGRLMVAECGDAGHYCKDTDVCCPTAYTCVPKGCAQYHIVNVPLEAGPDLDVSVPQPPQPPPGGGSSGGGGPVGAQ